MELANPQLYPYFQNPYVLRQPVYNEFYMQPNVPTYPAWNDYESIDRNQRDIDRVMKLINHLY
jgi:hypothetical protein